MRLLGLLSGLVFYTAALSNAHAAIVNGGFETGDFTGWSTTGVTSIETAAFGVTPTGGSFQALMTNASGSVTPPEVETFLGLSSGALNALPVNGGSATEGSAIKQTINANAGDVLSFRWNFLTSEGTPSTFNDFSFWSLVSANNGVLLADTNFSPFVTGTAGFLQQTGYQTVSYLFTSSGSFVLGFGVVGDGDTIVDSALLIDDVNLAEVGVVPAPASLILWGMGGGLAFLGKKLRRGRKTEAAA